MNGENKKMLNKIKEGNRFFLKTKSKLDRHID